MTSKTIYRELTAMGLLLASYPIDWLTQYALAADAQPGGEPIVLAHGFGGGRANLLGLGTYLRMAGYSYLIHFEYPRWQPFPETIEKLEAFIDHRVEKTTPVHLIGHSLGGTIARQYTRKNPGRVASLITLGSPYLYDQTSRRELAIFGAEDPIVPPPRQNYLRNGAFREINVLPATGHLGVLYHPEALRMIELELKANIKSVAEPLLQ